MRFTLSDIRKNLSGGIMAGICIGIAGTVYLSVANPVAGAVFFAFGLLTILCFGFRLYTGAVGYFVASTDKPVCLLRLLFIWLGNFAGTWITGTLLKFTRAGVSIASRAEAAAAARSGDSAVSLLILSFFCGILMYAAVESFHREKLAPVFRFFMVLFGVAVFILCGFEHCIADMYYFSAAGAWSVRNLALILLMTLGNSLGGMLIPLVERNIK